MTFTQELRRALFIAAAAIGVCAVCAVVIYYTTGSVIAWIAAAVGFSAGLCSLVISARLIVREIRYLRDLKARPDRGDEFVDNETGNGNG